MALENCCPICPCLRFLNTNTDAYWLLEMLSPSAALFYIILYFASLLNRFVFPHIVTD